MENQHAEEKDLNAHFAHQLFLEFSDEGKWKLCTKESDLEGESFHKDKLGALKHTPIIVASFRCLAELRTVLDHYSETYVDSKQIGYVFGYPDANMARMIEACVKELKRGRVIYCKEYSYNVLRK